MQTLVTTIDGLVWSKPLIYLCLGVGLFFSFKTRFLQLRLIREMWRLLLCGKSSKNGISSFQALAISLSGRVGTGNITGVATAIGFGGVKRIAHFTQVVVPFMALAYIIIACVIILLDWQKVPQTIAMIVSDAFTPMAGFGAVIGWGVKRGVYSSEAGQGTSPHAAAAAEVDHPVQQGLVQAFSVYIDTLFVCTATALMILITSSYNVHDGSGGFIIQNLAANVDASTPAFAQTAVESVFSGFGNPFVAIALFFFAFTTLLAYYFILEQNVIYLNRKFHIRGLATAVKFVIIAAAFYGTVKEANLAWGLGSIGVGIMAWLNIIGLVIIFFMAKPAIKALQDYEDQKKRKVDKYSFDPEKLGIKNAGFWVSGERKRG